MGIKPQALNRGDEIHLGWEMDRHATGLLACYGLVWYGFTLAHNTSQGKKKRSLARWTTWTNGKPISLAQILLKKKEKKKKERKNTHKFVAQWDKVFYFILFYYYFFMVE